MLPSDAFPSRFLQTTVVKAKGPIVATISHIEMDTVGQGAEQQRKPVLYFEDGEKPMVLNRTNFEILADAFGDSDEWAGHKVKIFVARTQYQGRSIDGLRVEAVRPENILKAG
jgi:hypothetical protein